MFNLGDVIRFVSIEAGKVKYHLCISLDGHYLFMNSPKVISYPGDYFIPCSEVPFLPPTPSGQSIISCTLVMQKSDTDLKRCGAKKLGSISLDTLRGLVRFVKESAVLTDDEKDIFYNATGDWI